MRINVQVIEESIEEKARRELLSKVVKPVRVCDFSWPVDYVPNEAEQKRIEFDRKVRRAHEYVRQFEA